jgi:hypothetical protein
MSEYMAGSELGAQELPHGSPVPKHTPPEGVIMSRVGKDGWTRKYLYRAGIIEGKPWQKQFLVSEIPPTSLVPLPRTYETTQSIMAGPELPPPQAASELPLSVLGTQRMEVQRSLRMEPQRLPIRMEPQRMMTPVMEPPRMDLQRMDLPRMDLQKMEMPKLGAARPLPLKVAPHSPMMGNSRLGQAFPIGGGTLPAGQPMFNQPQAPAAPAAPAAPEEACPVGPMQLPDGRMLNPDDTMTLKDLCAIIPSIAKALTGGQNQGGQRLGPVPVVGQQQGGLQSITAPNAFGQPGAGPGGGPAGGGGGMGFGFGGGGGGAPGAQGPVGFPGPAGVQGPAGIGSTFDFVSKVDGDFTAGPGAFIPVPGTLLAFSLPADGSVMFQVQATLGCNQTQNGALGLRVDGTDYPITKRLLQTVAGVTEFYGPSTYVFPLALLAGAHTVEVLLRGLVAGSECSASGLGLSQTISASPEAPLILICQHSVANTPAPTAVLLTIDGLNFITGPFTSGSVVPVPGTLLNFSVTSPGNAQFSIGGILTPTIIASLTNATLGIRIDGTDYSLCQTAEIQGAGGDRVFAVTLSNSITLPLTVGPHSAQLIFGNNGGVNQYQLIGSATQPATLSVIHS